MTREELALKLIELYYNNVEIFKARCMYLDDLCKKYKRVLAQLNESEVGDKLI